MQKHARATFQGMLTALYLASGLLDLQRAKCTTLPAAGLHGCKACSGRACLQVAAILGEARVVHSANGIAPGAYGGTSNAWSGTGGPNAGTKESALVDLALLARCDDQVTTLASSFGYVAAAWAVSAPVHMLFGNHAGEANPYWYRALSSEPCFWQSRPMMRAVNATVLARFKANPFWTQYMQCHY